MKIVNDSKHWCFSAYIYTLCISDIKNKAPYANREKMAKRFSCSKFTSGQLTQLINTHLMLGSKRSRNVAAAIWEVIATSCPHTLGGQKPLVPQCHQRGNTPGTPKAPTSATLVHKPVLEFQS